MDEILLNKVRESLRKGDKTVQEICGDLEISDDFLITRAVARLEFLNEVYPNERIPAYEPDGSPCPLLKYSLNPPNKVKDAVESIKRMRGENPDPYVTMKKLGIDPNAPMYEERQRRPGECQVATQEEMDEWRRKAFR